MQPARCGRARPPPSRGAAPAPRPPHGPPGRAASMDARQRGRGYQKRGSGLGRVKGAPRSKSATGRRAGGCVGALAWARPAAFGCCEGVRGFEGGRSVRARRATQMRQRRQGKKRGVDAASPARAGGVWLGAGHRTARPAPRGVCTGWGVGVPAAARKNPRLPGARGCRAARGAGPAGRPGPLVLSASDRGGERGGELGKRWGTPQPQGRRQATVRRSRAARRRAPRGPPCGQRSARAAGQGRARRRWRQASRCRRRAGAGSGGDGSAGSSAPTAGRLCVFAPAECCSWGEGAPQCLCAPMLRSYCVSQACA